jgi:type IV pilus assembly protein PilC
MLIIKISDWINSGGILVIVIVLLLLGALAFFARRSSIWSTRGWLGGRLPPARSTALARFSRFTADLLEAGLTLPDAVQIAGFSSSRRRLRTAASRAARALASADKESLAIEGRPLTASVLHALAASMPTASRIRLLKEISQSYADRARSRLSWTRGIVEPIAIIVIGLLVAIIVLSLFLPLVKLVEGLSS